MEGSWQWEQQREHCHNTNPALLGLLRRASAQTVKHQAANEELGSEKLELQQRAAEARGTWSNRSLTSPRRIEQLLSRSGVSSRAVPLRVTMGPRRPPHPLLVCH